MRTSRLLLGLFCLSASALAGCSGDSSAAQESTASAVVDAESGTHAYELASDSIGNFYFELTRTGNTVKGHAITPRGGSSLLAPMDVKGTVESDGTYRLTWKLVDKDNMEMQLALRSENGDLSGTLGAGGDQQPIKLLLIKPEREVPVVGAYKVDEQKGACRLIVTMPQVFGMRDQAREKALNDAFAKSLSDARAKCAAPATYLSGAAFPGVVNKDLTTYGASFTRDLPNDGWDVVGEQKVNLLASGGKVSLVGDVVAPGSEAKLAELVTAAVDQMIGRGLIEVIGEARKEELKVKMKARLSNGGLAKDFFVGPKGIVFGTEGFDPRVLAIQVTYDALKEKGILAPNGKARSAWESTN